MPINSKSIKQRLERAKSRETRATIVRDWSKDWETQQKGLCRQLERAIARNNDDALYDVAGEIKNMTNQRFNGLRAVFDALSKDAD